MSEWEEIGLRDEEHFAGDSALHLVSVIFKAIQRDMILMQFTGILDKNGKEIYEGDVVKNDGMQMRDVAFEEGRFVIRGEAGQDVDLGDACWNPNDVEIIGTIYENPELLKV